MLFNACICQPNVRMYHDVIGMYHDVKTTIHKNRNHEAHLPRCAFQDACYVAQQGVEQFRLLLGGGQDHRTYNKFRFGRVVASV